MIHLPIKSGTGAGRREIHASVSFEDKHCLWRGPATTHHTSTQPRHRPSPVHRPRPQFNLNIHRPSRSISLREVHTCPTASLPNKEAAALSDRDRGPAQKWSSSRMVRGPGCCLLWNPSPAYLIRPCSCLSMCSPALL